MELHSHRAATLAILLAAMALAGCRPEGNGAAGAPGGTDGAPSTTGTAADPAAATGPVALEDVMEFDPRYLIGISYPPGMERYPGLAAELRRYAEAARAELMAAVEDLGPPSEDRIRAPYDLALSFDLLMETPEIVAVQAGGSLYTGGAHGIPLVARFVWLPQRDEMLTAASLFQGGEGWREVSAFVRESLHTSLSQRLEADALTPADRLRLLASGGEMIDEGTAPEAGNFAQFEPVPGVDGRLRALRFVFPPYQVGPYSDGVQTVEVPSAVLLPHLSPEYRGLFATG